MSRFTNATDVSACLVNSNALDAQALNPKFTHMKMG
jgi:hypothetical protein